ncbi:MAG: DUF3301 domain-containing protein [Pseudomonadota bacterium]
MGTLWDFFSLSAIFIGVAYWWDAVRIKELARNIGKQACERAQVQILDDTVQLTKLRLRRNARGRIALWREYRFEFTPDNQVRFPGQIVLHGQRLMRVCVDSPAVIDVDAAP